MTLWGIDISNHQPGADLSKAQSAGCSFAFAKATEGGTYRDAYFAGFRSKAAALRMPLGAYHFGRPGNGRTGAQEASFFLSIIGSVNTGELPCVLDLESTTLGSLATASWALDWLRTVEGKTGIRPILYTYSAFAQAHLSAGASLATYPLWLANYRSLSSPPAAPSPWRSWTIWQHTSSASVPGVPGNCDRNITNLTLSQLKALGRPAVASSIPNLTPKYPYLLFVGSRNGYVKLVQARLNERGKPNPPLTVDGDFGPATERAVLDWQRHHTALTADGVVGPATWQSIFA